MTESRPLPEASTERGAATAQLEAGPAGGACVVKIGGDWRLSGPVLSWDGMLGESLATSVRFAPEGCQPLAAPAFSKICGIQQWEQELKASE